MNELNNWTRDQFMECEHSPPDPLIKGVRALALVCGMGALDTTGRPNMHAVCFFDDDRDPVLCFSGKREALDCRPVGDQPPVQFTAQPLRESGATLFYFMDPVTIDQGLGSCLRIVPEARGTGESFYEPGPKDRPLTKDEIETLVKQLPIKR